MLHKQNKQQEAYAEFQAATKADPKQPPAELAMAILSADKPRAEKWLKLALEQGGQNAHTRIAATEYLMRNNQPNEAKVQADAAIKLDPDGLQSNYWAGIVARALGDNKQAERHLSAAHLLRRAIRPS